MQNGSLNHTLLAYDWPFLPTGLVISVLVTRSSLVFPSQACLNRYQSNHSGEDIDEVDGLVSRLCSTVSLVLGDIVIYKFLKIINYYLIWYSGNSYKSFCPKRTEEENIKIEFRFDYSIFLSVKPTILTDISSVARASTLHSTSKDSCGESSSKVISKIRTDLSHSGKPSSTN